MPKKPAKKLNKKSATKNKTGARTKPVAYGSATRDQRDHVISMLNAVRRGVSEAIILLGERWESSGVPRTERDLINAQLGDFEAELSKIDAKLLAFVAFEARMHPPSKEQLNRAASLADELDAMIANTKVTNAAVKATEELLKIWRGTIPPSIRA
jgi:hypothetical protein